MPLQRFGNPAGIAGNPAALDLGSEDLVCNQSHTFVIPWGSSYPYTPF